MIYMVEMALIDLARRAEWDDWYLAHMKKLITIPGIQATQRFEALAPHPSPFVALHQVTGPEVFTSDAYIAKAGPGGTGEWRDRMNNWHRNVLSGVDLTPDVPMEGALVVIEEGASTPIPVQWTEAIGLDRSVQRRGLAVIGQRADAEMLIGLPGVRVCKPLTPRLVAG
ncbi:MAG: hypothetical protein EXR07_21200 [Acetobacteraceae bacterium]|nr:hypothetical protein [Acetobacteraceae bacterium]